ncbi:MarR family winged helix-turn-helix transcriptional regulator [Jatrophihabitans telluris]|uniref:MarR family winged helix-turn-helix transcriptional regulator n=1 Tax=Jatrophihabitans telluris TaxID=2038343 RepID=A0ABY4R179_9ACTN|nr:MarR family winged helix-turn-helix transcriptional regulator [Jatrophihabitans telluris]UQX88905.1 MarR family winged helix-turn-helix transcriptional regulator [Jatrophihabitans telluris]
MTQTSNRPTGQPHCVGPQDVEPDAISVVEREFGTLMMNVTRYKHQINGDRIDRMALMVLGTLSHCGPSRLTAIAERTGFDASHISRQVADLERAGLLAREPDPDDRRAVLLRSTEAGDDLMSRLARGRRTRVERLLSDWPADDIATFGRLLGRLNQATDKYQAVNAEELEEELNHG